MRSRSDNIANTAAIERWSPVIGYEGRYEVSDAGNVRSLLVHHGELPPRPKSQRRDRYGYWRVALVPEGERRVVCTHSVHRLVLAAFVGACPEGMQTRHLDGDKNNNSLANLVYGTPSSNSRDTVKHGAHVHARKTSCPQGHPYDDENTVRRRGRRHCKECHRATQARRRAEKAAA